MMKQILIVFSVVVAFVPTPRAWAGKKAVSDDISEIQLDLDDDLPAATGQTLVKPKAAKLPAKVPSKTTTAAPAVAPINPADVGPVQPVESGPRLVGIDAKMARARECEKKSEDKCVVEELKDATAMLNRNGLMMLARAYRRVDEPLQAARILQLTIAKNPKDYVVHSMLGDAYAAGKKSEDALNSFQAARDINPRYQAAYEGMLKEYERVGENYEARATIADMIKLFGALPRYHTILCRLYSQAGFVEKAVEVCQAATEKDPDVPENYVYLSTGLKEQQEPERADSILRNATKRFPASEVVQSTAGGLQADQKQFANAYKFYKQAIVADPNSSRALIGFANASFELQKNDEALDAFKRACHADRKLIKEFRYATAKLRSRKDDVWQTKFEEGMESCD